MRTNIKALAALCCLAVSSAATKAQAGTCSITDARQLLAGCNVDLGSGDFQLRLHAAPALNSGDPSWARNALNRTVVYVQGYNVQSLELPDALREDGTGGAFSRFLADGISVLVMSPGRSRTDRVEDDAAALREALRIVQVHRGPSAFPMAVFAHSMGGLISRIALAQMEAAAEAHSVALYVSYDAPHSGVNVPQGMQWMKVKLDEWSAMTEEDFIAIDPGWEGVFDLAAMTGMTGAIDPGNSGAFPDPTSLQAQQMTIQGVALPDEYPAFMALLDQTGFPSLRKIAISNGNTRGVGNTQAIPAGGELFFFTGAKGNSVASVRGTFQVFSDQPGATCFKSHVYYDGFLRNHDGGRKDADCAQELAAYDSLSGSTIDYATEMREVAEASEDDFHEPTWRAASDSAIPFVSTTAPSRCRSPLRTPSSPASSPRARHRSTPPMPSATYRRSPTTSITTPW